MCMVLLVLAAALLLLVVVAVLPYGVGSAGCDLLLWMGFSGTSTNQADRQATLPRAYDLPLITTVRCGRVDFQESLQTTANLPLHFAVRTNWLLLLLILCCSAPKTTGGAGGWFRPSGLFAVLLTALPGLKAALVEPLRPEVAASEPDMALSCLALLEAGVRWAAESSVLPLAGWGWRCHRMYAAVRHSVCKRLVHALRPDCEAGSQGRI